MHQAHEGKAEEEEAALAPSRQTQPALIAGSSGTHGRRDVDKQAMRGDNEAPALD